MIARTPSPHTLRLRAATLLRANARASIGAGRPPAHHMQELSFINRRVLRIIALHPGINLPDLDNKADLDSFSRPHADELVLYGLASRQGMRYTLTPEGLHTLHCSRDADDRHTAMQAQLCLANLNKTTGAARHG